MSGPHSSVGRHVLVVPPVAGSAPQGVRQVPPAWVPLTTQVCPCVHWLPHASMQRASEEH